MRTAVPRQSQLILQKLRERPPIKDPEHWPQLRQHVLTGKYFLLASLLNHAVEHP
jgi:hypothetical protein